MVVEEYHELDGDKDFVWSIRKVEDGYIARISTRDGTRSGESRVQPTHKSAILDILYDTFIDWVRIIDEVEDDHV